MKNSRQKQDFKKYLQEIESLEYNGADISRALPANANSLEKAKYKLCEKILAYQQDNNLPIEEVAKRIKLTTAETKNIFHYHLVGGSIRLVQIVQAVRRELHDYPVIGVLAHTFHIQYRTRAVCL